MEDNSKPIKKNNFLPALGYLAEESFSDSYSDVHLSLPSRILIPLQPCRLAGPQARSGRTTETECFFRFLNFFGGLFESSNIYSHFQRLNSCHQKLMLFLPVHLGRWKIRNFLMCFSHEPPKVKEFSTVFSHGPSKMLRSSKVGE
jgi:hypothetical protein